MIVLSARVDIRALAPAGRVEAAQEMPPFALELRLRAPARDERRAVARPGDARKISVAEIIRLRLGERRQGPRVEDRHRRLIVIADRDAPAGGVDRDADRGACRRARRA